MIKYKFSYKESFKKEKVKFFCELPTITQMEKVSGVLMSYGLYDYIIKKKIAHGMSGSYKLEVLNEMFYG